MDCSPPGSSVQGILQARILEWVAIPFPRDLPDPGIEHQSPVSYIAGIFFWAARVKSSLGNLQYQYHENIVLISCKYKGDTM